jgi:hypothetical protein
MKVHKMKKFFSVAATALLVAGLSVGVASAKPRKHAARSTHSGMQGATTGSAPMRGNNAELMGNNGNSASGSNSLGHIQGGNIGAGK